MVAITKKLKVKTTEAENAEDTEQKREREKNYVSTSSSLSAFELICDENKSGSCLWISNRRGLEYWPTPIEKAKYKTSRRESPDTVPLNIQIPQNFEKIIVHTLSHNFRSATSVVRAPLRLPLKPDDFLMKIIYAGVNASDERPIIIAYPNNPQNLCA
ncbi:unnamed protein product [Fraxinus pennsylvanica]|uniref:Uncharacterized protein n=1 Tax=Fraxinus pennsylvanica TaxID=56036 RepID=A0AAD2A9S0_9LAMI|nr:unnamed protein product [Fraxinus pennsylvanica]